MAKRDVLHIKVGTPDWVPSDSEIQQIANTIHQSLLAGELSAIVSPSDTVEIHIERVDAAEETRLFVMTVYNPKIEAELEDQKYEEVDPQLVREALEQANVEEDLESYATAPFPETLQ